MLEAQINLRIGQADTAVRKRGDVVAVKPAGAGWAEGDEQHCVVVQWDDPALESQLQAKAAAGDAHPVIVYPYATYDTEGAMTAFSTESLDLPSLPLAVRAALLLRILSGRRPRISLLIARAARKRRS